ncbi:MAG: hypothetical protein Q7K65_00420 [Candidatus Buchananbacteria bacterium]|nr:hypothetical protein [Candidatus Buchananbacteria bacterium]
MNKEKIEKIFSPLVLIAINLAVILIAELTGQLFFMYGIIHMIAILFIALSIIRIFVRYYSFDPILEKFFMASLAALFVFALSHIVEYFSMSMGAFVYYSDSVLINTANFYLISLMLIIIGADAFLRVHDRRSLIQINVLIGLIAALIVLIFVLTTKRELMSLELDNPTPYVYTAIIFLLGLIAMMKINRIGKHVSISTGFTRLLHASIIMIMLSTVPYIFYEFLESNLNFPLHQVMYLSHFFFYASLSLFFLAFGRINIKGGIYEDLKKASLKDAAV